jgi:alanine racemase
MARAGCPPEEWDCLTELAAREQRRGRIRIVGVMGHLAHADRADPRAIAPAISRCRRGCSTLQAAGIEAPIAHLVATAGALTDPATQLGMVRFGAGLVGIDPSGRTELAFASRLTAPVVHSATVPAGTPVGYGSSYVTREATNLSVLPLGYADSIPREITPAAWVEIGHRRCRMMGRVSMDQIPGSADVRRCRGDVP